MDSSPQFKEPRRPRLGGGTAAVAGILGLICFIWAIDEALRGRITVSADPQDIQGVYPCGSVLYHRPACAMSVYASGTATMIVAAVLTVTLLTCAALIGVGALRGQRRVAH